MGLLFGFREGSLAELAAAVGSAAGIHFALHDSLYRGGDYYRHESDGEQVFLQNNVDALAEGRPVEEEFPDFPFLLYVSGKTPKDVWESRLATVVFPAVLLRSTL